VRAAEDAWNNRNPQKASLASKPDSQWRNRLEFFNGREAIRAFLKRKWASELDYRLIKKLWAFTNNRIAVRFAFEWRDANANGFRSYCDENWEFDAHGTWPCAGHPPMICRSRKTSACFTGRTDRVRLTILASAS